MQDGFAALWRDELPDARGATGLLACPLGRRLQAVGASLRRSLLLAALLLDEGERRRVAERLVQALFARGNVITRQGATAHWLYSVVSGEAEVAWEAEDGERRAVTRLPPGSIFGEMGPMTGEPCSATVVAATDVERYRLDRAGFEDVLRERPSLAEGIARILARRQAQNDALRSEHPTTPAG